MKMTRKEIIEKLLEEITPIISARANLLKQFVDEPTKGYFKIEEPRSYFTNAGEYDFSAFNIKCEETVLPHPPLLVFRSFAIKDEYEFVFACQEQITQYKNEFEHELEYNCVSTLNINYTKAFYECLKAINKWIDKNTPNLTNKHSKSERYPAKPPKKEEREDEKER